MANAQRARSAATPPDDEVPTWEPHETHLVICPGLSWEEWEEKWQGLNQTQKSIQWLIGDALKYAAENYDERYAQAIDPKWAEQYRGYLRVALRIPQPYRRSPDILSWSAHREAASAETLEERIELLDLAEQNDWGSREIAEEIRRRKEQRRPGWNMGPPLNEEITPAPSEPAAEEPIPAPEEIGSTRNRTPRVLPANPPAKEPAAAAVEAPSHQIAVIAPPTPQPPPDGARAYSPEDIRAAIVAVRQIANPLILQRASEPEVQEVERRIAGAVRLPVSLRDIDQSLLAIPPQWKIRMMEAGEHVFGGRMWTVELLKGKSQVAIGVCPSLPCALLDAAMSAILSDMGAG